MGRKQEDLTGKKFNRLIALKYLGKSKWLCKCDCGNYVEILAKHLKTGKIKSCGCYKKELDKHRCSILGKLYGKRNQILATKKAQIVNKKYKDLPYDISQQRVYRIWMAIKSRCKNKNNKNYGARGIKVCEEWLSFEKFYNWAINNGYQSNLTIDRINNNGNYEPSNCRWATYKEQNRNKRSNKLITLNNGTFCITEWEEKLGFSIYWDLKKGFSFEDILKDNGIKAYTL